MKHLLSYSVYQDMGFFGRDPAALLRAMGCDGLEMLTSYDEIPDAHVRLTSSVHLPYATDWLAAWEGRPYVMDEGSSRIYMYGRSPEDVVSNIEKAVRVAEKARPPYGVMHLANADIPFMHTHGFPHTDSDVISNFSEVMNRVASAFPGGEPPFQILFENLWWPGLRMTDMSGYRLLERKIEFSNWGICLDVGHLMSCLPGIRTEQNGIEAVLDVVSRYDEDAVDRIRTVHFHYSASSDYRDSFEEKTPGDGPITDFLIKMYPHVSSIDRHMPFSDSRCAEILESLRPEFVTHEMPGSEIGPLEDFIKQRSLLQRSP